MSHDASDCRGPTDYELHFVNLFAAGRAFAFPCDAGGRVDLDGFSESIRNSYPCARALIGRDFAAPVTRAVSVCRPQASRKMS